MDFITKRTGNTRITKLKIKSTYGGGGETTKQPTLSAEPKGPYSSQTGRSRPGPELKSNF